MLVFLCIQYGEDMLQDLSFSSSLRDIALVEV